MFERVFLVKSHRYCVYKRSFLLPAKEVVEKSDYVRKKHMRDLFLTGLDKCSSFGIAFCALHKILVHNYVRAVFFHYWMADAFYKTQNFLQYFPTT